MAFILTRSNPLRLLTGYFIGGFGLSLIVGIVLVFILKELKIGAASSIPPGIEIAVGALALLVAVLVGMGISAKARDAAQVRHPEVKLPNLDVASHPEGPPGIESMPGFAKLPERVKNALSQESPWVAWIAGLAVGMPTAYYLAAIAAILNSGSTAGAQVAALIVFNVISFAQAEVPIVSYLIAPEDTRSFVEKSYVWVDSHQRLVVTVMAAVVGVYLLVVGISKL